MAKAEKPVEKPKAKPKLTDAERHRRFVETAHAVEADESEEAFEKAFKKVAEPKKVTP
jgi:hypothetical protein